MTLAGNPTAVYTYGINLITSTVGSTTSYYLYNAHGDVTQLVDTSGTAIKYYRYDAFGNEINANPNDANPFRYSGQYFDKETGDYYLQARYYDPANGRFTQQDDWGYANASDPLSLNLYTYCTNNPVNLRDLNGHIGSDCDTDADPGLYADANAMFILWQESYYGLGKSSSGSSSSAAVTNATNEINQMISDYQIDPGTINSRIKAVEKEHPKDPWTKYTNEVYTTKDIWTDSSQCFGFACYVYNKVFGIDMANTSKGVTTGLPRYNLMNCSKGNILGTKVHEVGRLCPNGGNTTADQVKKLFSKAQCGDWLQMVWGSHSTTHSAIFVNSDNNGVWFLHANYRTYTNETTKQKTMYVSYDYFTYTELSGKYSGIGNNADGPRNNGVVIYSPY